MFSIDGYELDKYQIESITGNYSYKLVVAGAGAGKTSTILGNIKYLLENKLYKEEEILCISFTNETVNSLKNKIQDLGYNIDVRTFHKLSLDILDKEYSIVKPSYLEYIIDEYFKSYVKNNYKKARLFKDIFYTEYSLDRLFYTTEYYNLKRTIITFINLLKSQNYGIKELIKYYFKAFYNEKTLITIILEIYLIYKRELESTKQVDFNDMILLASKSSNIKKLKYKYIIIDEFQDTSNVRFNLIREIIKYKNAKLFVVGDDWQSIYRFSGCNLNIFLNFTKFYKDSYIYYLKYTYRNSQQLIDISANFIMKNNSQLKKKIESFSKRDKPIKICYGYSVDELLKITNDNTMILGRTNKDIEDIKYDKKLTIHKSKGLEATDIIIVHSDNIPSKTKSEKILRFVLNEKEYYPFEEERRIFYVALTRAKNDCYIMVDNNDSIFIKELKKDFKDKIEIIKK